MEGKVSIQTKSLKSFVLQALLTSRQDDVIDLYKAVNRSLIMVESLTGIYLIQNSVFSSIDFDSLMVKSFSFEDFEIYLMMQSKDEMPLYLLSNTNYGYIISNKVEIIHQTEIDHVFENHLLWESRFIQPEVHD